MRYQITLSYSGADFFGWQVQPDRMSVQGALEKALSTLLGTPISVTGAGRTDTGVNALGYVAHFDAPDPLDCGQLCYKLNAILPRSIAIIGICEVPDAFHARFDASRREYTYFLHTMKDPFVAAFSYQCGYHLDFEAMNRAASALLGTHDFSCFEKLGTDTKTSICTVAEARWCPYVPEIYSIAGRAVPEGRYWYFRISADRFLRNMVRAVVGTLLEVGRGKRSEEDFAALILPPDTLPTTDSCRRCLAGESVPGHALFLSGILYAD